MGTPEVQIPITLMLIKEVTIKGSFRYGVSWLYSLTTSPVLQFRVQPGDYPLAISLVAQGKVDLKPLVTHRLVYPFGNRIKIYLIPIK
jgi:D-xylulose reductase